MVSNRKIITSDDVLGKDAIDPDGQILGVIIKMHINKEFKKITGITIDEGFMKPNLFVGINYIKNFGIDSVFLSRIPAQKYIGLQVLDSKGKEVGTVKDVKSKRQKIKSIEVFTVMRKRILISSSEIQEIGERVILKDEYKSEEIEKKE